MHRIKFLRKNQTQKLSQQKKSPPDVSIALIFIPVSKPQMYITRVTVAS